MEVQGQMANEENWNRIVPPANEYYNRRILLRDSDGKILPFHVLNITFKWTPNDIWHTVKYLANSKAVVDAALNHEWLEMNFVVTNLGGKVIEPVDLSFIGSATSAFINFIGETGEIGNDYR